MSCFCSGGLTVHYCPFLIRPPESNFLSSHLFGSYEGGVDFARTHFERLFASIPHDCYRNNPIAQYEGYYASVFYSHLAAMGFDLRAEDVSNHGRCDLAVLFGDRVYLFEFKVIEGEEPTGEALKQLLSRD